MEITEYDDYTPAERSRLRAEIVTDMEYPWRTGKALRQSRFLKQQPKERKDMPNLPLYIDTDLMEDLRYMKLSIVAKYTWFTLIYAEKELHELASISPNATRPRPDGEPPLIRPGDLNLMIMVSRMMLTIGRLLNNDEIDQGIEELILAELIHVDDAQQVTFSKYIAFDTPEGDVKDLDED